GILWVTRKERHHPSDSRQGKMARDESSHEAGDGSVAADSNCNRDEERRRERRPSGQRSCRVAKVRPRHRRTSVPATCQNAGGFTSRPVRNYPASVNKGGWASKRRRHRVTECP